MNEQTTRYLIRDDDSRTIRPLDLLQAWGPPAHPPLRVRIGRAMVSLGEWVQGKTATGYREECAGSREA
jgi:hypothetical protein